MKWVLGGCVVGVVAAGMGLGVGCSGPRNVDAGRDGGRDVTGEDASAADASDIVDVAAPPRCPGPFSAATPAELALRHQLGVPDDAGCVVMFGQNSHMDIDWLHTFDDYYRLFVENILLQARGLLDGDPAYRYSVCEMGFLSHHLAQHPEETAPLRAAVARGALHIVGGGITSPDTLLPTTEPLVRDYLRGTLFAESQLGATVHAAWLPDSFGHAPTVPDLLAGMGITSVAFARVDGLHDPLEHIWGQIPIVPGSTADRLTQMHANDFVWVGPGGGEVLGHWLPARLYCEGDTVNHTGVPVPGGWTAGSDMTSDLAYQHAQIAQFVGELTPYARTPYLFVPIGCDFQPPNASLLAIVREWNTTQYPQTGIYVVASTFEDYASLVETRRADLPRLSLDMSDYFSGYFGSRLAVKAATRSVGDRLVQTEVVALLAQSIAGAPWPASALGDAWDLFSRTDHHDFISGTALDEVVTGEQLPMLQSLDTTVSSLLSSATTALGPVIHTLPSSVATAAVIGTVGTAGPRSAVVSLTLPPGAAHDLGADVPSQIVTATRNADGSLATATVLLAPPTVAPLSLQRFALYDRAATGPVSLTDDGTTITLADSSNHLTATLDHTTGRLQSLRLGTDSYLTAPSLGIQAWNDQGGLYRIGSETHGCSFAPAGASTATAMVTVVEHGPARARVRIQRSDGAVVVVSLVAGSGRLDVDVTAPAMDMQSNTLQLFTTVSGATASFAHAAGVVSRAASGLFAPTFWPVVRGADLARADGSGLAVLPRTSTGLRYGSDGSVDVMVSRNARLERCDVLGAQGTEQGPPTVSLSLVPHASAIDVRAAALALLDAPALQASGTNMGGAASVSLLALGGSGYVLSAAKQAERGAGWILRFERTAVSGTATIGPGVVTPVAFTRTDLLERDRGPAVSAVAGSGMVALDAPVVTVRVGM